MSEDALSREKPVGTIPGRNGGTLLRGGAHRKADSEEVRKVKNLLRDGSVSVAKVLLAKALKGDPKSIELALAYGIGKPTDKVELSGPEGGPIEVMAGMDDHERRVLRDAIRTHLEAEEAKEPVPA